MELRYTELFGPSIQGEGLNIGRLCTWLRTFSCTLECMGFGQENPADSTTWQPQYTDEQIINIKTVEDVPTPKFGCDSAYSWSKKFRHVAKKEDTATIAAKIRALTPNDSFENKYGHVFTGGEPLMHQKAIVEILTEWFEQGDTPAWICFETNGTVKLSDELCNLLQQMVDELVIDIYFSISPKLLHVAGEQPAKAIHPKIIADMIYEFPHSYIKMVLNKNPEAWKQAEHVIEQVEEILPWSADTWVMPVGGTYEQQDGNDVGDIADMAIAKGWNVSPRVHVLLWKNEQIGR